MMAALPPPPPGLNIYESQQPSLYAAQITTYVLAVATLGLRFWARSLQKTYYGVDDWLMLGSVVVATGLLASTIVWLHQGYGLHLWVLGPTFLTDFFKNLFVGEILYTLIICLVKFSILSFYWRLFSSSVSIRFPIWVLTGITAAWGISVCLPVPMFWDRTIQGTCINQYAFFIGIAVPNIVTDIALLILPIPYVWRLHRPTSQKVCLLLVFLLGSFVSIISAVRLSILVNSDATSPDVHWNFAPVGVWTTTEANMAIVSGCLPSLRPVLTLVLTGSPYSQQASSQSSKGSSFWSLLRKKSGTGVSASGTGGSYDSNVGVYQGNGQEKSSRNRELNGTSATNNSYVLGQGLHKDPTAGAVISIRNDVDVAYER